MLLSFAATAWLRRRGERYVSTGLMLFGIASFIGAVRASANPSLAELHGFVSALALCTGLPLIAVQYVSTATGMPGRDGRMNTMGVAVVGFAAFGLAFPVSFYADAVGVIASLVIAAASLGHLHKRTWIGLAGLGGALALLAARWTDGVPPSVPGSPLSALLFSAMVLGLAVGLPHREDR